MLHIIVLKMKNMAQRTNKKSILNSLKSSLMSFLFTITNL